MENVLQFVQPLVCRDVYQRFDRHARGIANSSIFLLRAEGLRRGNPTFPAGQVVRALVTPNRQKRCQPKHLG